MLVFERILRHPDTVDPNHCRADLMEFESKPISKRSQIFYYSFRNFPARLKSIDACCKAMKLQTGLRTVKLEQT
ncbi:hypothetical protein SLEP1_g44491 [Rubroshorea leprosula]|uniref:Uncharacterized protein n=1 Tax=Rubroshorea leprosula TaxID=152421 RepID=A0AAV5LGC3_9ROSI|nr:hypothetical protein SLEP1_g44491 [Rubroshorea leprosula]